MAQQGTCCLPRFGSASERPKRPMSLRIRLNPSTNAELRSAVRDGRLSSAIQVTWAIVLHCYTDSGDICFGYQHVSTRGSSTNSGELSNFANLTVVRLAVEEADCTHGLMTRAASAAASWESVGNEGRSPSAEGYLMFNTVVAVRIDEGDTQGLRAIPLPSQLNIALPEEVFSAFHS